jgi:hypothetical protein
MAEVVVRIDYNLDECLKMVRCVAFRRNATSLIINPPQHHTTFLPEKSHKQQPRHSRPVNHPNPSPNPISPTTNHPHHHAAPSQPARAPEALTSRTTPHNKHPHLHPPIHHRPPPHPHAPLAHQHRLAGRELPHANAMGSAVSGRARERVEGVCVGCYQCACE